MRRRIRYVSPSGQSNEWKMSMRSAKEYTYRIFWSSEDDGFVAIADEFPSLSAVEDDQAKALESIDGLVQDVLADMEESGETPPEPLGVRRYSGKISLRMSPEQHRRISMEAAEAGVSLNKLILSRI